MEFGGNNQMVSKEDAANNFNAKLLETINESGKIYMTHAVIGGEYVMRFAVGASLTENRHVILAWKVVQEHANALLTNSWWSNILKFFSGRDSGDEIKSIDYICACI